MEQSDLRVWHFRITTHLWRAEFDRVEIVDAVEEF